MQKASLASTTSQTLNEVHPDALLESRSCISSLNVHETLHSFIQATRQGYYNYWVTLADVIDIARVEYNNFKQFK